MKLVCCAVALLAFGAFADPAEDALALAQRTLAYVERTAPRPEQAAELKALAQRLPETREAIARHPLHDCPSHG
jgi:hypothetical protein